MSENRNYVSSRFAAGIVKRIYQRPGLFREMKEKSSLKEEINSEDFQQRLRRLSPEAQRVIGDLLIVAEEHGALNFIISCVYGIKEENPKYFDYLKKHIACWDNRKALERELESVAAQFKAGYGFNDAVDRLLSKARKLDDAALSLVYASLSGIAISTRPLSSDEIRASLTATENILDAW
ncbi:MAG: hypothetical protein QXU54_02980 [Candidatus Micrarchaeia archaeon]